MVARNAPLIEVSPAFSARLALRLVEERRARIAEIKPSHVERRTMSGTFGALRFRTAAAVVLVVGGSFAVRAVSLPPRTAASSGPADAPAFQAASFIASPEALTSSASPISAVTRGGSGDIIVVTGMRPVGGALLPLSDDPLLDGDAKAGMGDASATSLAATAPLWPTAQMAAHAANRFAAMEFGDVRPVSIMQTSR